MKTLLILLCAVLSIGFISSGGGPTPDPEAPMCQHEGCVRLRSPAAAREGRGPGENPANRYRADTPTSAGATSSPRHIITPGTRLAPAGTRSG